MLPQEKKATRPARFSDMSALIVDDERLPRIHLAHLLQEAGVGTVLQARDGAECLEIFETEAEPPDWVFLDVQMPEMNGLSLSEALQFPKTANPSASRKISPPLIVIVTGHEEYAVQAFELPVVDYLLKPISRERLTATLTRLDSHPARTSRELVQPNLSQSASGQGLPQEDAALSRPALERLPIRLDYAVRLVNLSEIVAATAHAKNVDIITTETIYPTRYTLNELETRLPPDRFVRVHDSWIVNLAEILEIYNLGGQSYQIRLRSENRVVPVSRRRMPLLQQRLGL